MFQIDVRKLMPSLPVIPATCRMNARKFLTGLILMIVFVSTARADIYDTRAQDEKRYGAPVGVETPMKPATYAALYRTNGVNVLVQYVGNRSVHKKFWRPKGHLTPDELKGILDSHSTVMEPWKKAVVSEKSHVRMLGKGGHWLRGYDNAEAFAAYDTVGRDRDQVVNHVVIATKSWLDSAASRF